MVILATRRPRPVAASSAPQNKDIVRRYAQVVWIGGNLAAVEDYISPGYVRHDPGLPMDVRGPEGIRQIVSMYRAAFPDIQFTPEPMMAEGDMVAVRWLVRGTQRGELMGIPPTGKPISITAIELFRLENKKIVEQWVVVDNLGLLQQLGAIPAPGAG